MRGFTRGDMHRAFLASAGIGWAPSLDEDPVGPVTSLGLGYTWRRR